MGWKPFYNFLTLSVDSMMHFFVFVLGFLGLVAGIIIAHFTQEELKPGRKYFIFIEKLVLLIMALLIISFIKGSFLFFVLGIVAGFLFRRIYFYFGIALPLVNGTLLLCLSSLIFIFGLAYGSLKYLDLKKKFTKDIVFSGIIFFCALIVFSVFGFDYFLMFVSGAFISISVFGFKSD